MDWFLPREELINVLANLAKVAVERRVPIIVVTIVSGLLGSV